MTIPLLSLALRFSNLQQVNYQVAVSKYTDLEIQN